MRRLATGLWMLALASMAWAEEPLFRFGVIADPQYADKDTVGARRYRDSLAKLAGCATALHAERPEFVVQVGDLVDGGMENLEKAAAAFLAMPGRHYSVLGNHDFAAPRAKLLAALGMPSAYYAFAVKGWRFIVLDGLAVSTAGWPAGDPHRAEGQAQLDALAAAKARNAHEWNGALGAEQRAWLGRQLQEAAAARQRAIVFCHQPVLAESCRPEHLLWDHAETAALVEAAPAMAAWFNGHDHRGGYARRNGVHYTTLPGMVESDVAKSCKVVDVYADRLVLRSAGDAAGQTLTLR